MRSLRLSHRPQMTERRRGQQKPPTITRCRPSFSTSLSFVCSWCSWFWLETVVVAAQHRSLCLDLDIFGQGLEPPAVGLHHGNGNKTGLSGFDILNSTGFAFVCAGIDFALGAVG